MAYSRTTYASGDTITAAKLNGPEAHLSAVADAAVHAYRDSGTQTITEDTITTVVFDAETFDLGSDYNTTTGEFTAPTAGLYLVAANLYVQVGENHTAAVAVYVAGSLRVTLGEYYRGSTTPGDAPNHMMISGTALINVSASDVVTVRIRANANGGAYGCLVEYQPNDGDITTWRPTTLSITKIS